MRRLAGSRSKIDGDSLRHSLENSLHGVTAFRDSLRCSGMDQAREQYKAFAHTLLHQRGFALRNGRREFDPEFREIGRAARECAQLLGHYHSTFGALSQIDSANPYQRVTEAARRTTRVASLDDREQRLLCLLLRHRRISPARAALEIGEAEATLLPAWDALRAYDLVERVGWGRGTSYRLPEPLCRALADALLGGLAPRPAP